MGTSGAYGGSNSAAWNAVLEEWAGVDPGPSDGDGADDGSPDDTLSPKYAPLAIAIAEAIIGADPEAKPVFAPPISLASLLPRRSPSGGGMGGGTGAGGPVGGSSNSGGGVKRQVIGNASRGGAAIGAASAYRDRDASALGQYGITLEELDRLTPRNRCARLLDLVLGEAGHPDEAAARKAVAQQVKQIIDPSVVPPTGLESIRNFIGELTIQAALVQLKDQILANVATPKEVAQKEKGLRQWIAAKLRTLDLGKYGTVTTAQFHQVAATMARDALNLIAAR